MRTVTLLKLGLLFLLASGCSRAAPSATTVGASSPAAPAAAPAPAPLAAAAPPAAAPPSAPAPAPAIVHDAAPRHATALRVDRLVIARGVEAREPLGTGTVFDADEKRVFAFVDVDNPEHAPGQLWVRFVAPDGEQQPPVELSVGQSPRWRTWAFTRRAHAAGTWKAVVSDERGHVLASTEFAVRG